MYEPWWGKALEEDTTEGHHSGQVFMETNSVQDNEDFPIEYPESQQNKSLEFDLSDNEDDGLSDDNCFHTIAFLFGHGKGPRLPNHFRLKESYPGEPFFMKLRQTPAALRFHKVKQEKDAEKFWFSEAMLYVPHIDEEDLVAQINKAKLNQETWEKFTHEISLVKSQVMEHLAE